MLTGKRIDELWSDPLLRQSNILDGLFSHAVVLCEAESDCSFYAEVRNSAEGDALPTTGPVFRHANGKDRLHLAASALRGAGVPVSVIADIDMVRDQASCKRLLRALGGVPPGFDAKRLAVATALDEDGGDPTVGELRDVLLPLLGQPQEATLKKEDTEYVKGALKYRSKWSEFSRRGIEILAGDAKVACEELLQACAESGLYLVPLGQLESWAPSVHAHGNRWLVQVLENGLRDVEHLDEARSFVDTAINNPAHD